MKYRSLLVCLCMILAAGFCTTKKETTSSGGAGLTAGHREAEEWAEKTLASLPLEKKVGQMICEQMRGEYAAEDDPAFRRLSRLVKEYGIGGFVLYGGTPHDTARLLNRLQEASEVPLLISADFEGGPGQQIRGATEFPANMALSAAGSEELAYRLGEAGAVEGRAIGIHLTYSPVVDVQTRPENPVLSVRSFGGDLELLGRMAAAYIRGYQENGMLATAKHYPGRGDVELIPGTEFTVNRKPAEKVEAEDFLAFQKAIEAGVTFIMSEHIAVPSVTGGSMLPASVEKQLAATWLRDRLGFQGILTTDDMWYRKVVDRFGPVKACIRAVEAGHDVILKPADAVETIKGLVSAVREGILTEARIDRSVKKILYWKARLNLHRNRFVDENRIAALVGTREHLALAQEIADRSLTLLRNDGFFPADPGRLKNILHLSYQKKDDDTAPGIVASKLERAFPGTRSIRFRKDISAEVYREALEAVSDAGVVIVSLFNQRNVYRDNGPLPDRVVRFLRAIMDRKPKATVVMSYGNPYLARSLGGATAFATGYGEGGFYGNQTIYADSFIKLLKGEISPRGKLPVKVSDEFPMGCGITY